MPRGRLGQPDKYPQQLYRYITQATNDSVEAETIPLPVPRFGSSPSRPYVFELLRIRGCLSGLLNTVDAAQSHVILSTVPLATVAEGLDDPRTFFQSEWYNNLDTSGNSGNFLDFSHEYICGDKGLLIGTDNIYLIWDTANTSNTNNLTLFIEYRVITVSASEYVGIVQSQQ